MVEQWTHNPLVIGSIPVAGTTFFRKVDQQNGALHHLWREEQVIINFAHAIMDKILGETK
jgi:hypothetical protein